MNHTDQNDDFFNDDVIDSIADGVPVERRAAYYREMRHLRSLPHNDEMLHIVYILHFPMLMMVEIPKRLRWSGRNWSAPPASAWCYCSVASIEATYTARNKARWFHEATVVACCQRLPPPMLCNAVDLAGQYCFRRARGKLLLLGRV